MGAIAPVFFERRRLSKTHEQERTLQRDIEPAVEHALPGVEVLAVELSAPDRFTVYIDRAEGVDHALCERVTDVLRDYLREYSVDVSSPGIERPLRKPEHFRGVVGRRVALRTVDDIDGRKRFRGEVVDAGSDTVTLRTDGDAVAIPYDSIIRGNLISEGS